MATDRSIYQRGLLTARPAKEVPDGPSPNGQRPLNLASKKDGLLYVPETYDPKRSAALALMLHGAGGEAAQGLSLLRQYAEKHNIILLAPASRASSWDIISREGFDQDVIFIDQALAFVFAHYAIDPAHIAIGGFSDGASYALSLGLSNGDLFTHIIAFSPGFKYTMERRGKPAVFASHGISDPVLPIDPCSRRIVPQLQRQEYAVHYLEFEGGHEIPANISAGSVEWFLAPDQTLSD